MDDVTRGHVVIHDLPSGAVADRCPARCRHPGFETLLELDGSVLEQEGEYKPKPGEPKIWFTSMKSVAEVLSDQNRALLKVIRAT